MASRLGIKVIAPATVLIGSEGVGFAALLPQFGGKEGIIADPDWETIRPHAKALMALGYGFSAVELGSGGDDERWKDMLRDWGWSANEPKPSWW